MKDPADRPPDEDDRDPPLRQWSRAEVEALAARSDAITPWRVVRLQVGVAFGVVVVAGLIGLWIGGASAPGGVGEATAWMVLIASAGYGSACAVLPSALMAWGLGRRSSPAPGGEQGSRPAPVALAVRFLSWEFVKIGVSVVMLLLAPVLVQPIHWPALLAGLVLCTKAMWLAPLLARWRGPVKNKG